ncbi:MAPEG family protein [Rhodobacterales bacterium HKCCE4037]|nr:MAPEG family protein [Rhodobacterales bacterium HKCCE4037]
MTPELTALALAILLQALQFAAYSVRANLDVGPGYAMSARDREPSRPLSDLGGRLQRALNNHFEGLILFTAAVVLVSLSGRGSGFTAACAWVYLGARVLYVPAYALGLRPWRSLVWFTGFLATIAMVVAVLFSGAA